MSFPIGFPEIPQEASDAEIIAAHRAREAAILCCLRDASDAFLASDDERAHTILLALAHVLWQSTVKQ